MFRVAEERDRGQAKNSPAGSAGGNPFGSVHHHRYISSTEDPLLAILVVHWMLMAPLGIFSSRVIGTSANEALISGTRCGSLTYHDPQNKSILATNAPYINRKLNDYLIYAEQCYQTGQASLLDGCKTFTQLHLPYVIDQNASCPFAAEMCKSKNSNLVLDTQYLHSYKHLGMNRGPPFLLRHKIHCAPLVTKGFSEVFVDPSSGDAYQRYKYGRSKGNSTFLYQVQINATTPGSNPLPDYKVM